MKRIVSLILCVSCFLEVYAQQHLELLSPNKTLKVKIGISDNGALNYSVFEDGKTLIEPSALGITVNKINFGKKVEFIELLNKRTYKTTYPIKGKHAQAKDFSSEYEIKVTDGSIKSFLLIVRLFDDGMAFRYKLSNSDNKNNIINGELSSFKLPVNSRIWFFERNNAWKLKSYAGEWLNTTIDSLPIISSQGPIQGKPLIAELACGSFILISEAALENYSGMRLKAIKERTLQANFTETAAGFHLKGEIKTPWRVVTYSKDLNSLVNSDIITNLNPAPDKELYKDQSYIKPGKAVWSWITKDSSYMTMEGEKKIIDNAQKISFDYTMIDEGWESKWANKWISLKELCDYGKNRKIGIWVWRHSNKLMDAIQRGLFLDSIRKAGAVGIKVDFMNSEAKGLIDFEIALLKDCAKRKLMVNFHGCQPPTGESRTYPNEMTREGIRGMELNIMAEGPITASHNAALPFTRLVVGHGDYTPGFFSKPGKTTWGHQFATMYLFDSPFLCMAENPATIINDKNLNQLIPYLKEMPVVWDETIVLPDSKPGKLAAMARRRGKVWYVAVINGEHKANKFILKAGFLPKGRYKAEIINDKFLKDRQLEFYKDEIDSSDSIALNLEAAGGFVAKLSKK